jgi:hypothetical protein
MKLHRPSPAMVVSIIALIVALGGTAVATTKLLITSTSQVKDGVLTGKDLRDGSVASRDLSRSLLVHVLQGPSSGSSDTSAVEAHRLTGPDVTKGGKAPVASLDLQPGVYAVFAKVNMTPNVTDQGLLDTLFKSNKTIIGSCTLDVAGTGDYTAGALVSPGSQNPLTLSTQVTRTLDQPATATLTCQADQVPWRAADASIIAMRVGNSTRTEVTG